MTGKDRSKTSVQCRLYKTQHQDTAVEFVIRANVGLEEGEQPYVLVLKSPAQLCRWDMSSPQRLDDGKCSAHVTALFASSTTAARTLRPILNKFPLLLEGVEKR
ncbi:hypothetical protein VM1G_11447 [Cytospora mali]|uniref:Uncharacterized protein n=1 Tax=Cytospora mali TaxID=578113 RepID=A0A194VS20_CYTMA|nr:hypothetical protein VM1G_11447 [Valsa mali]